MTQRAALDSSAKDNVPLGIGLTVIAVMIFGVQDAAAKILVQTYSPFQIGMLRFWALAGFSLFLVARQAPILQAFRSTMPGWQIARGILLVVDIWLFSIAIKTVPLAELHAISLIYPLLVTLFAIPLLGERVGLFRFGAVAVGFMGALVIIRPGGLPLDVGVLYTVLSAVAYALYVVCTRKVAQRDSIATSMVYVGVIGMVMTSSVGVFFWQPMDGMGILLAAGVMATTVGAHGLMMVALRFAPASAVQPFNYLTLPWAIVLSIVVFGHYIDFISLLGAVVVVAAGLVVWVRERRRKVKIGTAEVTPASKA